MNRKTDNESAGPRLGPRWGVLGGLLAAVVLPLAWVGIVRGLALDVGEAEPDSYYHVAMADAGPRLILARHFPALTMSVWAEHFCDKELLFHLLLGAERAAERWLGLPPGPPFHGGVLLNDGLLLLAFAVAAWALGARQVWWFSPFLVLLAPALAQRWLMLRPHVLSVALLLLSCAGFARLRTRRGLWCPFLLGVVYAYTYSNPHFILIPALAFAVVTWRTQPRLAAALPLVALAGVVTGYVLHPQFPHTFVIWKTQCVDVVWQMLRGAAPISLGIETARPDSAWLARNGLALLLLPIAAAWWWRQRATLDPATRCGVAGLLLTGAFMTFATFLSQRAFEYAGPCNLLAVAVLAGPALKRLAARPRLHLALGGATIVLLAVGLTAVGVRRGVELHAHQRRPCTDFARWAATTRVPAGTVIANVVWSDFPQLFQAAPQFRYLVGLDPMFGYARMPDRMVRLEAFRTGQLVLRPEEFAALVGARYAFVSAADPVLARHLQQLGFVLLQGAPDGWVFDLPPAAPGTGQGDH